MVNAAIATNKGDIKWSFTNLQNSKTPIAIKRPNNKRKEVSENNIQLNNKRM